MLIVGIPYYESDVGKRPILNRCVGSLKGQDSIVVLAGKQKTLALAQNMLFDMCFGMGADHVIISNDDVILTKGTLDLLCQEDRVVSPMVNGGVTKIFHAHMFCMPRKVFEKLGRFDENFIIYWMDTDYAMRMRQLGIEAVIDDRVNIDHPEPGRTLGSYHDVEKNDEQTFIDKWGERVHDPFNR